MGFSDSWVAVRGVEAARALEAVGLEIAKTLPAGDYPRSPCSMGEAPGGWLLFLSQDIDDAFKGRLLPLTALGPAVACAVEEHVMHSEARGYEAGRETWRASHDSEKGIYHLDASGELPAFFAQVRDELREQQDGEGGEDADVDLMFDIPQRLAREICGFQLGEEEPAGFRYSELRKAKAAAASGERSGGFLSRLFGRR